MQRRIRKAGWTIGRLTWSIPISALAILLALNSQLPPRLHVCFAPSPHSSGAGSSWSAGSVGLDEALAVQRACMPQTFERAGMLHMDDGSYRRCIDVAPSTSLPTSPVAASDRTSDIPSGLHPIYGLISRARLRWARTLDRQSPDLVSAVAEYRRRHGGRMPPAGFDKWFTWAKAKNVRMLDEYDSIRDAFRPFYALSPNTFRQRVDDLTNGRVPWSDSLFTVEVKAGEILTRSTKADDLHDRRAVQTTSFLKPVAHLLPDMVIPYEVDDLCRLTVSAANMERHLMHARAGTYVPAAEVDDLLPYKGLGAGWTQLCPKASLMRQRFDGVADRGREGLPAFVAEVNRTQSMDFCHHPELVEQTGIFIIRTPPALHAFWPLLTFSRPASGYAEILVPIMSQWHIKAGHDPPWDNKTDQRLLWRGQSTGLIHTPHLSRWYSQQRTRLVARANGLHGGTRHVRYADPSAPFERSLQYFSADVEVLGKRYYDIAFTQQPIQCEGDACDYMAANYRFDPTWMQPAEANSYKYHIDLDGNGWSGRFRRVMSTTSAVLKSTVYPEWYTDRIQPWLHYIPVRQDYSDLDDIMAFFTGNLSGHGSHDSLGKMIGQEGANWVKEYWRIEDMQAYAIRVFLEFNRLLKRTEDDPTSVDLVL